MDHAAVGNGIRYLIRRFPYRKLLFNIGQFPVQPHLFTIPFPMRGKKTILVPEAGIPPPKDSNRYLTPAEVLSQSNSTDPFKPSPDPDTISSIEPRHQSSSGHSTEKQFPDVSRLFRPFDDSPGSSIHLSFSNLTLKRQQTPDDAITRSILEDISDHDLLYSSNRQHSRAHRIGISLLPDVEMGKAGEEPDCQTLGDICSQFSAELRHTKEELAQLYRENKDLREQIRSQDGHIEALNVQYSDQTAFLKQEIADLRSAVYSQVRGKVLVSDDTATKPTFDVEDQSPAIRSLEQPCCQLF